MLPAEYEPLLLTFHEPRDVGGATVIGSDYGTELRLVGAEVHSVDPEDQLPEAFVNSSCQQLAECIAAHAQYCRNVQAAQSEEAALAVVEWFAAAIAAIDPACVAKPDNWWSTITEQMRNGLL